VKKLLAFYENPKVPHSVHESPPQVPIKSQMNPVHMMFDISSKLGFEVLTAVSTKTAVFWVVAPCSLVEVLPTFQRSLLHPSSDRPDDGSSKHL
jgi:hypothetical protein